MAINGIEAITYGVEDLTVCRKFFADWGLTERSTDATGAMFATLNGCEVRLRRADDPALPPAMEAGPTLREVTWSVDAETDLRRAEEALGGPSAIDPTGLAIRFAVSRKSKPVITSAPVNAWDKTPRVDQPSAFYDRATPIEVGHIVLFTDRLAETEAFYREKLGFVVSDRYPGRGVFLRGTARGGHHDLFLLSPPNAKSGLNHVAFAVRDIHEVFGGGLHISRCGWETQLGPGRHPISSAYFWYVKCPAGGLAEYYADEDYLTEAWKPREFTPSPTAFAEWAIDGGIDGNTRRQRATQAPDGKFMTEKR
jgi:catechol 2,3-dioxygenase-like lactoylglutathione lyase family enzyme